MPKRGNDEREWEDGFAADAAGGILAVADGASDGIFSKLWVDLLLESFVRQPVALDDPAAVEPWIQERRRQWFEAIRYPEQRWSIQLKIDRSCGASTFLGLRLDPAPPGGDPPDEAIGWTAWVVGDICLFHIRDGGLVASFPIAASADFNTTPQLYQSKAMRPTPRAVVTRGELRPDDLLVFATDATAQRLLAEVESGTPPGLGPVLGPGPGDVAAGDRGDPRPERDRQRRLHPGGAPAPGSGLRRTRRDEPDPAGESRRSYSTRPKLPEPNRPSSHRSSPPNSSPRRRPIPPRRPMPRPRRAGRTTVPTIRRTS